MIKGSLAEIDRDATVKWNYIDLRFQSPLPFRIEVSLTTDKLKVQFRALQKGQSSTSPYKKQNSAALNDCFSCGNLECFKHSGSAIVLKQKPFAAYIYDRALWPKYQTYLQSIASPNDRFLVLNNTSPFLERLQYVFGKLRQKLLRKQNIFAEMLLSDEKIARKWAKSIPLECTHLVVPQNLLPFLWKLGVLGGRTFDVLMQRLPIEKLHERLDYACKHYPDSPTLSDFRAHGHLVEAESQALTTARHIITPHLEIARLFQNKATLLNWNVPIMAPSKEKGKKILFPASSLARKGAIEMKRLSKELRLSLIISGKATEYDDFWEDLPIEYTPENPFDEIGLIIYPTYVEHQPRLLLRGLALGIPIITTTASGLGQHPIVSIVPLGDYQALKKAVLDNLQQMIGPDGPETSASVTASSS